MDALLRGLILGFSIAAPVGPIGLLVIRRSLTAGAGPGFISGLGAATADLCFGALAAFGLTLLARWQQPAALLGGLLLCWLAWKTLRSQAGEEAQGSGFFSTFLLTLSSPMTILSFAAMVAGVGATAPGWFIAGVFLGSLAWWAILSSGAALFRHRITPMAFIWINRTAAAILFVFGITVLSRAVSGFLA